jgi:pimeloyl-ACP methyl ester carboxylesterase
MESLFLPQWQAFLRYEDLPGASPVCVYLAGLGLAAHTTFASVAVHPSLAAHRSVFVDLLGCGFSDRPEQFGYSLEDHAMTVAMALDALELKQCAVIGYSMGGAVAIPLATRRPDLVSRLVLMEANLDPGGGVVSRGIAEQTEAAFCAQGFQAFIAGFRQEGIAGDTVSAAMAGIFQVAAPQALHRSAVGLIQGTQPMMREQLLQMTIPRVYIFGEKSLPDPDWEGLPRQGIQVLRVPDAGHGMAWDNPGGVAEALKVALSI